MVSSCEVFKSYEDALEDDSFIALSALPHAQALTAEFLGLGNEQVYLGRKGWLFYEPDVAYLTGPGFLEHVVAAKSAPQHRGKWEDDPAGPEKGNHRISRSAAGRGIRLILMPIPVKPMIEPEFLSRAYDNVVANPTAKSILWQLPGEFGPCGN